MATITVDDLDNLRHMLGVGNHIKKRQWGYRNYFAASNGQVEEMERLVSAGFVTRGSQSDKLTYYHATENGMDAIGMNKAAKNRAMEP